MAQKQPPYVGGVGTIGVGSTTFTVTGALDDTNCIEGDHVRDPATGYESRVLERLTVQTFRVPPWRGAALAGAAYELYPDSNLRGGYQAAVTTQLLARLSAKGLIWNLPTEFASPTAAKWGADQDQRVFSEPLKKWWKMDAGAWVQTAGPYGMMASDALADVAALGLQASARANIGSQANLGYVPANLGGDTFTGWVNTMNPAATGFLARTNVEVGGVIRSEAQGGANRFAQFYKDANAFPTCARIFVGDALNSLFASLTFDTYGNLAISGSISAGSKSFVIDHPIAPLTKDLVFMATEAPKAGVEFWGTARLADGQVEVDVDAASGLSLGTFAALTQNAIVAGLNNLDSFTQVRAGRVVDGRFAIYASEPTCTDEVVWIVKAERADPYIKTNPYCDPTTGKLIPEHDKPEGPEA